MHPGETPAEGSESARGVIVAAIPARYAATRLPGKVLTPIAGRPMVEHVYRRAAAARGVDRVVVLTDDERVARTVAGFGGRYEMTPADCESGSDRIAHAARSWDDVAAVINVQGDEPLIDPEAITAVASHLAAHPDDPVVTLATEAEPADLGNPHVVKVVTDRWGYALYFSRAPIPFPRRPGAATPWRHLGIYGYQLPALLELAELPPSPLERAEALEQLRALENGLSIRVIETRTVSLGVDTADDLARVESLIEQTGAAED